MRIRSAFSFRKRRQEDPDDVLEHAPVSSATINALSHDKGRYGALPTDSPFQEASASPAMHHEIKRSSGRSRGHTGEPVNTLAEGGGVSKTGTVEDDENHVRSMNLQHGLAHHVVS